MTAPSTPAPPPDPRPPLPALFVLSGLVDATAASAPRPPADVAELQLRAIEHRRIGAALDPQGELLAALVADDFLALDDRGEWLDRAAFLARRRAAAPCEAAPPGRPWVRLFGPVALVHGVIAGVDPTGRERRLRSTDVQRWDGTRWRLVGANDTPIAGGVPASPQTAAKPPCPPWRGEPPAGEDAAVLRALNERYVQAFRESDIAWYDHHLAPDFHVTSGDGSFHDRAAALGRFAMPTFATRMRSFPVGDVRIRTFGDVALVHAENAYELLDGRTGVSRYTDIWHRGGADGPPWRCLAAHITVRRAPA